MKQPFALIIKALLFLSTLLPLLSCGKDSKNSPSPPLPPVVTPPYLTEACPNGTVLTYQNFGQSFLTQYCTPCHSKVRFDEERVGAPASINLDNLDDIDIWRARMINALRDNSTTPMPPSRHLSPAERILALEWLSCGAPAGQEI